MNRRFSYSILVIILVLALLTVLSGCGPKKQPKEQPSTPTLKTIKIIAEKTTVYTEGTLQFSAEGYDQNGRLMEGVTFNWSVDPAKFGEITQDGMFTAGTEPGVCQIVCAADGVVQRVSVTIKEKDAGPSKPNAITIKPDKALVYVGGQQKFEATVWDQYDQAMSDISIEWILDEEAGEIKVDDSFTATFTASDKTGTYTLMCKAGELSSKPVQIEVTSAKSQLKAAGEQLVNDSQLAWDSFMRSDRLANIFNEELIPHANLISSIVYDLDSGMIWYSIFCLPEWDYTGYAEKEIEQMIEESGDDTLLEGRWTYNKEVFDENDESLGIWTVDVTRTEENETEKFVITNATYRGNNGETKKYRGTVIQPFRDYESFEDGKVFSSEMQLDLEFELGKETNGYIRLSGEAKHQFVVEEYTDYDYEIDYETGELIEVPYTAYDTYSLLLSFSGGLESEISESTGKYTFSGSTELDFGEDDTDTFVGTIETPSAVLNGEATITYVNNEHFPGNIPVGGVVLKRIPKKFAFIGSLEDRESVLSSEGEFALEFTRMDSFDFSGGYTSTNWPGLKLSFEGTLQDENGNQMSGTISLVEVAYKRLAFNVGYELDWDGVPRQINLYANNSDDGKKVQAGIESSWGPAKIDLELTFDPEFIVSEGNNYRVGKLVDLSGTLKVQGEQVGTIYMESGVPWVSYIDGGKETL